MRQITLLDIRGQVAGLHLKFKLYTIKTAIQFYGGNKVRVVDKIIKNWENWIFQQFRNRISFCLLARSDQCIQGFLMRLSILKTRLGKSKCFIVFKLDIG